ncbi:hypothetical protein BD289DRAFT_461499 [Coniella lustricola]|uniref:DUF676 domain-containing protein n=1 Tax=Coniella lustricola TaxID=2025994 RepID=A0A2T3A517_9PEZI|nr:hypothetical protein BD289DRAFT_461499 [Coniella lustricola]
MPRTLLLCFVHGFKGNDDSFGRFPEDLKRTVSSELPGHKVESVVYPQYATKGELAQASINFLEWLRERVMEVRKADLEKPWPPNDRQVGVVLVAHSMGGFVASDALFQLLNERAAATDQDPDTPLFPLIQGILTFDTPYNGLARSLFVYGAFSNYQRVSSVWNVMTALSAAPAGLSMALKRTAGSLPGPSLTRSKAAAQSAVAGPAAWKTWQLVAVRTGTVGAIAAGGVAAYVHRQEIMAAAQGVRNLKKQDIVDGYQQGIDRLGQGLAYINRGNVGHSLAWLSDHFTFVGVLMKQQELSKRLERLAALRGIGIHDIYASMGENGYWSGGYFVPERTFCAIPVAEAEKSDEGVKGDKDDKGEKSEKSDKEQQQQQQQLQAHQLFSRHVVAEAADEIEAHMSMFKPDKNDQYQPMVEKATKLVVGWFNDDSKIVDDPSITQTEPAEKDSAEAHIKATDEGVELESEQGLDVEKDKVEAETSTVDEDDELPDESPLDIAAAASLVPPPGDGQDAVSGDEEIKDKQTYVKYLMNIAHNAGTGVSQAGLSVKDYIPSKLPTISTPSMPAMPSMSMPKVGLFSRKEKSTASVDSTAPTTEEAEEKSQAAAPAVDDSGEAPEKENASEAPAAPTEEQSEQKSTDAAEKETTSK